MRLVLRALALAALLLSACGGYGYGYVEIGYYYPCDPYYDPYCYGYAYAAWAPASAVALDVDRDGHLDLVVGDAVAGTVWVVRGDAKGGFLGAPRAVAALAAPCTGVLAVRSNGDDVPDLLVEDGGTGDVTVLEGDGRGGFGGVVPASLGTPLPQGVVRCSTGGIDGDAYDDLAYLADDGSVHVALGTGTGTFDDVDAGDPAAAFLGPEAVARRAGLHVALGSFDGRPGVDLVVVDGERATLAVFSGNGDGTFRSGRAVDFAAAGPVLAVAAVTVVARGPSDLAVLFGGADDPSATHTVAVVRLDDGRLDPAPVPVGHARALVPGDFDGDGLTDLLLSDPVAATITTLHARRR